MAWFVDPRLSAREARYFSVQPVERIVEGVDGARSLLARDGSEFPHDFQGVGRLLAMQRVRHSLAVRQQHKLKIAAFLQVGCRDDVLGVYEEFSLAVVLGKADERRHL